MKKYSIEHFDDDFCEHVLRKITPNHIKISFQWLRFMAVRERWNLSEYEIMELLDVNIYEFEILNNCCSESLSLEKYVSAVERISLLLKLSRYLKVMSLSENDKVAYDFFLTPTFFENRSIKKILLDDNSINNFYSVIGSLSFMADSISLA